MTHLYGLPPIPEEERVKFIQCSYLAAKSDSTSVEAPSHLFPAWPVSDPDWHSYDSQFPAGLWVFVQQSDSHLHLLATEESPPPSVNQVIKQLIVIVHLSHLTLLCLKHENIVSVGSSLSLKPQSHNKDRMFTCISTFIITLIHNHIIMSFLFIIQLHNHYSRYLHNRPMYAYIYYIQCTVNSNNVQRNPTPCCLYPLYLPY